MADKLFRESGSKCDQLIDESLSERKKCADKSWVLINKSGTLFIFNIFMKTQISFPEEQTWQISFFTRNYCCVSIYMLFQDKA